MPRNTDVERWQHLNDSALISMHGENGQQWLRAVRCSTVITAVPSATR